MIGVKGEDSVLQLSFNDDGLGVAENEEERMFQRGFDRDGGLGLLLSREILARHRHR